jgi:hypothetical protein
MSLLYKWKEQYYNITARDVALMVVGQLNKAEKELTGGKYKQEYYSSMITLIDHALQKWVGLTKISDYTFTNKNLTHSLTTGIGEIIYTILGDGESEVEYVDSMSFDSTTCSLCMYASEVSTNGEYADCNNCPIVLSTGNDCEPVYLLFADTGDNDPIPMINLLKSVKDDYESRLADVIKANISFIPAVNVD